jgi:hypothetical protein
VSLFETLEHPTGREKVASQRGHYLIGELRNYIWVLKWETKLFLEPRSLWHLLFLAYIETCI